MSNPQPPEFEKSRPASPDEIHGLPGISHVAIHVVERCIEMHHVVEINYKDAAGKSSKIRIRPGYIRYNVANHLVLWGIRDGRENWEEFRLDRLHAAQDTGEVFTPSW
ncbi:MAG: WYL domain-containing protein [Candidatus Dormibacteraceae bacterium]